MSESAFVSYSLIDYFYRHPNNFLYGTDDHLRNPLTRMNDLNPVGKIDQDHF